MIVYVETNFVLELALSQEEHEACRELLDIAKKVPSAELALPAVSVGEAYDTFERKRRHRAELHDSLRGETGQLTRSAGYGERSGQLREITSMLVAANRQQRQRMEERDDPADREKGQ